MKRLSAALTIVLAAGAASAPAQAPPPAPSQPGGGTTGPSTRQQRVTTLLNRAITRTYAARPDCRPADPFRPVTFTDDPPRPATLDAFAILRRPGTAAERAAADEISDIPAEGVYRNHVRFARAATGRTLTIAVARDVSFYEPRSPECVAALRGQARRVLRRAHAGAKTRRAFRRGLEQVIRDEWTAPAAPEEDGFFVLAGGGGAGGSPLSDVKRRGLLIGGGGGDLRTSEWDGLIPDGVARVRMTFRGGRVRTAAVRDNVLSFRVRLPATSSDPRRMAWFAADGKRVRVVRFP